MIIQSPSDPISKLGIVGAGTMGSSIAVCLSQLGLPITLIDKDAQALANSMQRIDKIFASIESKYKTSKDTTVLPAQISNIENRKSFIQTTNNFTDLTDVDLIIEAANEDLEVKQSIFSTLDKICQPKTILASNTSSFSITQLASFTKRPQQTIGMHFFNPAHIMSLVEIIPGLLTSTDTIAIITDLVKRLNKLPIKVEECASFLVNRLLSRYINEAIWILQNGIADVKTIDEAACQLLMPIGPLKLRDMNGLDIGLAVAQFNYNEYGERFKPPTLLKAMVDKKMLGRKTKAGFYIYDENQKPISVNPDLSSLIAMSNQANTQLNNSPPFAPLQLFLPMINEAFLVLQEKIVSPTDIDPALQAGLGMKQGLLEFAFNIGLNNCLAKIENLYQIHGERFRPAPLLKRYVWADKNSL